MLLSDVYQILEPDDKIAKGDEFQLLSIADEHIWGPCVSFVGRRVHDVHDNGRIIFRRRIAQDQIST